MEEADLHNWVGAEALRNWEAVARHNWAEAVHNHCPEVAWMGAVGHILRREEGCSLHLMAVEEARNRHPEMEVVGEAEAYIHLMVEYNRP